MIYYDDFRRGFRKDLWECRLSLYTLEKDTQNRRIYVTTRSKGYRYQVFSYDFWLYELADMKVIFQGFEIMCLSRDYNIVYG